MPANNTNQSMLRAVQGGSPTSRGQNERSQRATRTAPPNTSYNQGSNNMFSQYAGQNYSPWGMNPAMGQYGNQQANLGRYQPPGVGSNQGQGGYAYNLPNAYGGTGLNYMSGFGQLANVFNPFMGNQAPNSWIPSGSQQGYWGGGAGGFTQQPDDSREAAMAQLGRQGNQRGMFGNMLNTAGYGNMDSANITPQVNTLSGLMQGGTTPARSNVDPSGRGLAGGREVVNIPQTFTPSTPPQVGNTTQPYNPFRNLPWGFGG